MICSLLHMFPPADIELGDFCTVWRIGCSDAPPESSVLLNVLATAPMREKRSAFLGRARPRWAEFRCNLHGASALLAGLGAVRGAEGRQFPSRSRGGTCRRPLPFHTEKRSFSQTRCCPSVAPSVRCFYFYHLLRLVEPPLLQTPKNTITAEFKKIHAITN